MQWTAHGVLWPWVYDRAVQGKCAGLVQTPVKQPILPELRGSCQPSRWCTNTPLTQGHPKMVAAICRRLVQRTAHGVLWPWAYHRAVQGKCAGLVQTPLKQPILPEHRGSCQPSRWCTNTPLTQGHPRMVACRASGPDCGLLLAAGSSQRYCLGCCCTASFFAKYVPSDCSRRNRHEAWRPGCVTGDLREE